MLRPDQFDVPQSWVPNNSDASYTSVRFRVYCIVRLMQWMKSRHTHNKREHADIDNPQITSPRQDLMVRYQNIHHRKRIRRAKAQAWNVSSRSHKENILIVKWRARTISRRHSFCGFLAYDRIICTSKHVIWDNLTEVDAKALCTLSPSTIYSKNGNACVGSNLIPSFWDHGKANTWNTCIHDASWNRLATIQLNLS